MTYEAGDKIPIAGIRYWLILTFGDTARLVEGEDTTIEGGKREGNDK